MIKEIKDLIHTNIQVISSYKGMLISAKTSYLTLFEEKNKEEGVSYSTRINPLSPFMIKKKIFDHIIYSLSTFL